MKNIVLVGSASGAAVARKLEKLLPDSHRVILIEKNGFAYWPVSALRSGVREGFEESSFADLDGFFPAGSRHVVLKGNQVTALAAKSVNVAVSFEGSHTIEFEYAVLALGSTYASPCRPASADKEEAVLAFKSMQRDVSAASSILVIGGGPVGIEFAGEVKALYPDKSVTLVTNAGVMPGPWRQSLKDRLKILMSKSGVKLIEDASVEDLPSNLPSSQLLPEAMTFRLSKGDSVSADFVLTGTGGKPNTQLVTSAEGGAAGRLNEEGRICVNPQTLQVLESQRYFAIGDCANAPGAKTAFAAEQQAPVAAANVLALIGGKQSNNHYAPPPSIMVVPFGPTDGAFQGPFGIVLGGWATSLAKGKTLLVPKFKKLYNGP